MRERRAEQLRLTPHGHIKADSVHQLHGEVEAIFVLTMGKHRNHVGMVESRNSLRFGAESPTSRFSPVGLGTNR